MHSLDFIVIAVYLVVVLAAGMAFVRTGTDMESFFGGGGKIPWWISGTSLYMSFFSAGTFVVWGAIAYELGWVAVTMQWTMCVGGLVTALIIAPRWRRTGALTAAAFLRTRFGPGLQQFYSYLVLFYSVLATGAVLYPVAKMVAVATPFSLQACILVLGGVVILYTATGGLWAVVVTDTLQFVILTAAVVALVPLALSEIGGVAALAQQAPAGFFDLTGGEFTLGFMLAFALYHVVYIGGQWGFVQRYTSVPDRRAARKVGLLFAALYVVAPVIWMLPPMAYRVMNPSLTGLASEGAYILISEVVLPAGVIGLMFAAMISATASSANTMLNITAAVVTNDLYKDWLRPAASERAQMIVARLSTVGIGILMVAVALLVPAAGGIVNVVISMAALLAAPILAPPVWALFSRYLSATGALWATLIGFAVNVLFKFVTPALLDLSLARGPEMAVGVGVPVGVLLAFELRARARRGVDPGFAAAFATKQTDHAIEEGALQEGQHRFALRVLATMLGCVGVGLVFLSLFVPARSLAVLAMGGSILAVGTALWIFQKKRSSATEEETPAAVAS